MHPYPTAPGLDQQRANIPTGNGIGAAQPVASPSLENLMFEAGEAHQMMSRLEEDFSILRARLFGQVPSFAFDAVKAPVPEGQMAMAYSMVSHLRGRIAMLFDHLASLNQI